MNAITPLLPALHTLEPLGLPATFQGWYAYASAGQSARLARHLEAEFAALGLHHAGQIDHVYLRSEAFQANVVQAVRAAEVAESEDKLRLIARALAGCLLHFPPPSVDKFQTMRVIEGLSAREMTVLVGLFDVLDPIEPYADLISENVSLLGFSRQEGQAALLGLGQLGLVQKQEAGWKLTPLARQVALLCRLEPQESLPF